MGEIGQPTVGGVQVHDLLEALGRLGAEPRQLCAAVRVDPNALRDPDARVPAWLVLRLFHHAEQITGDPLVGLHAGERTQPTGPIAYLILSSTQLEEGIRRAHRFGRLILNTLQIRHQAHDDTVSIIGEIDDRLLAEAHHAVEYFLMLHLRSVQRAAGEGLHPRAIHVRHADRGQRAAVEKAFGCPVHFDQQEIRVVYGARDLQVPSQLSNPCIAEQIEKFAAALEARVLPLPTFREQCAVHVRAILTAGLRADLASVARRLGVSGRSLRRGLESESTSFSAVRDGVLREVAEALLSRPMLKVEAVAFSVGFADAAAFSKAFKRWAGCSPTEYRLQRTAVAGHLGA